MAETNITTVAPGVRRYDGTRCYTLNGKRGDIIAAGLAKDDWFPSGVAKNNRGFNRSKNFELDGRRIRTLTEKGSDRVSIAIYYTEAEIAANEAKAQKADAQQHRFSERALPDPKSLSALIEILEEANSSKFQVGDIAILWKPDYEDHGAHVEITHKFGFMPCADENGRHVHESGQRFNYRFGYKARCLDGKEYFVPAGDLRDPDGRFRHISLLPVSRRAARRKNVA